MRSRWTISVASPAAEDVRRLVGEHLAFARAQTPPEYSFALDTHDLDRDGVTLFALRAGRELVGLAALKDLGRAHGEIKSMHTAALARRRGVGRALLDHLMSVARERGLSRLSLETGTQPAFSPARTLYASAGFAVCDPFADYAPSPYSVFMTRSL